MTISQQKAQARKAALAARKMAFDQGQGQAAQHLAGWLAAHQGKILAGYLPMRTEIDPRIAMAAHQGTVCVPIVMGVAQPLRFRTWTQDCELMMGAFGADIPVAGEWLVPDLLIVPMVAWDRRGYRLGYGGGFYDRSLEELNQSKKTLAVGFAFNAQEMPEVPVEATDKRLDVMITETEVIEFS